jgi:tetratricopeptide (TPR) repeat protein
MVNTSASHSFHSTGSFAMKERCSATMCRPSSTLAPANSYAVKAYTRQAESLLCKHDLTNAILAFSQVLRLDPASVESLIGRAKAFIAVSSFDMALRDLTQAISLATDNIDALALRSALYLRMQSISSGQTNVYLTLALADASEVIRLDPECRLAIDVRANVYRSLDGDTIFRSPRQSVAQTAGAPIGGSLRNRDTLEEEARS